MEQQKEYGAGSKPGPKPMGRISTQISVTIPPTIHDKLEQYMRLNGLNNKSGTIAKLIAAALSEPV